MAIVVAFNMVYLLTLAVVTMMSKNILDAFSFVILSALVTCQVFQIVMVGGLFGKSALAGIGWASLLSFFTVLAFEPPSATSQYDDYRSLLVLPLVVCIVAAPPLLARFAWGWQLIDQPQGSIPFRRFSLEDIFTLTASVAAMFVLLINTSPHLPTRPAILIDPFAVFTMLLMAMASVPMLGIVYLHFRRGLDAWATFLLLLGLYLPHHIFLCMVNGFREPIVMAGAPLCALGSFIVLLVYKASGFSLVHFDIRLQRDDEELNDAERRYMADSRRSARVSTIMLLLFTMTAVAIYSALDSRWNPDNVYEQRAD